MKKIILCFVIILSIQLIHSQKVVFGAKAGGNFSSYIDNFESPFDFKYKIGFQIGGFARIKLSDRFFLKPELLYSLQGTKYDFNFTSINLPQNDIDDLFDSAAKVHVNESTILLPILARYYISEIFSVEFGPQLDYLFSSKESVEGISNTDAGITNDMTTNPNDFNLGLNASVGFDVNDNISVVLRYHYGFNRLEQPSLITNAPNYKRRNSAFSLSLEYLFK